jgi:uncharacterized protein YjbI with pentapeptide repeats
MANNEHVERLRSGITVWNEWRNTHPNIRPELAEADLGELNLTAGVVKGEGVWYSFEEGADGRRQMPRGINLSGADLRNTRLRRALLTDGDFRNADVSGADFWGAELRSADFRGATLDGALFSTGNLESCKFTGTNLRSCRMQSCNLMYAQFDGADMSDALLDKADLRRANCSRAKLVGSDLTGADLGWADLSGADLTGANLMYARLIKTKLQGAVLHQCRVFGTSTWDVDLTDADQDDLDISYANFLLGEDVTTPSERQATITVDDIEVAQFVYMMLDNRKFRNVIETMTSVAVLLLGNFSPGRKAILDTIRKELRTRGYLPIVFDFEQPESRDLIETITILARLARFVIADLSQPRSVPDELRAILEQVQVPIQPVIEAGEEPYATFATLIKHSQVLRLFRYHDVSELVTKFNDVILRPAECMVREIEKDRKNAAEKLF